MESATRSVEHVSISIDEKLARHSDLFPKHCIFKVHEKLRKLNPDAYEPEIVAIGPYHREKTNLQGMEELKLLYLKSLLVRKKETSADRYITAMRELEEKARKCYAEPISLSSDEFVHMMLLDGCFIIELFLKCSKKVTIDENDPIFGTFWMVDGLRLDLILFENQLPFFVLLKLYDLIEGPKPEEFTNIALSIFDPLFQGLGVSRFDMISLLKVQHLLDLLHSSRCPSRPASQLQFARIKISDLDMQSASQLQFAGIKFKKAEGNNLFDITYSNETMRIPHLTIEDRTEYLFRNLITHEQYGDYNNVRYITDYWFFMDYLIVYPEDLSLLRRQEIITNRLGGDEVVSNMVNELCHNIITDDDLFSYGYILNMNTHCRKPLNRWKATLRCDYFNNPWTLITVLISFVLMTELTLIQTIYAVLSYLKKS